MESVVETGMEAVTGAMSTVLGFASTVLTTVTGNPILVIPIAAGFVGIGIGIFRKLWRSVR